MRIRTVTIEGFGPFKERQHVNFREFDADGLFLIAGETGVGKTSILDAIAYALYNKTPRWDNVSAAGASNAVRSDFCGVDDPTEVIVEFETNGLEYRVTRSPEFDRPKTRGEGTTRQSARVVVEVLEGDTWVGKATKEREAAELVQSLLKLNKDEFLQVIMLAQGRFQEFLLATSEQRLELLSKLFGTERFAAYQARLAEQRGELRKKLERSRAKQGTILELVDAPEELGEPATGEELDWLDRVIAHAAEALLVAAENVETADTSEKAALARLDLARKQARAASARETLAELTARQPEIDATRAELKRAQHADKVRPLLDDVTEKREAAQRATEAVAEARAAYEGSAAEEALGAEVARLTEELGALNEALRDEQRMQELASDITEKTTEADALTAQLAAAAEAITRLQEERAPLVPTAAQAAAASDEVARAKARLDAAREAARVAETLRTAQEAQLAADQALTAARAHADDVLDRFLNGQAAVLAKTLEDGQPCAVCGSTEHPSPAEFTGEPLTQDDVDAAQARVTQLEPPAAQARDRVDELKVTAATLAAAAGEGDIAALTSAAESAQSKLAEATAAARRIEAIDAELNGARPDGSHPEGADGAEGSGLVAERARLETAEKAAATALTTLRAEHDSLAKKVAALRGEFASVAARQASLVGERDAAKALVEALAALTQAATQRSAAEAKLAAKLTAEKFETVEEVEGALRDERATAELTARIDEHAAAVSENQGILKQPDLQGLPDEVISVTEATVAHAEAQSVSRAATTEKAKAESRATQLQARRAELAELLAATEELAAEFALLNSLTETVHGRTPNTKSMSLESYYIAAELEDVLAAANIRLHTLSQGRFELRHTERGMRRAGAAAGLEIEVFDEFTGTARPANQLSGGQQFLASLALALGLAEAVTSRAGGIELNTLFVDEGFGSLSTEYLEIAMSTLDSLKQGGRTVGVISHVTSMQEQIAAQLRVVAEPGGPSRIAVEAG